MRARFLLFFSLILLPLSAGAQREVRIPLHHGCGELVYTRDSGWTHQDDTTGTLHFPRRYDFDGGLGHGLLEVTEYDADSIALRTWRISQVIGGISVEQAPFGRCVYSFDSLGFVTDIRCENMKGEERPAMGAIVGQRPIEAPSPKESPISNEVSGHPIPTGGSDIVYVFDPGGNRLGVTEGKQGTLVWIPGIGAEGEVIPFADPVHDPGDLDSETSLEIISAGDVRHSLRTVEVYDKKKHGLIRGIIFLKRESDYSHRLDFARTGEHPVSKGTFYVSRTAKEGFLAHNNYNFGNFLWGAAARAVGVPLWIAKLGSHINNIKHTGKRDSPDDILSISAGYHFSKEIGSD